MRQLNLIAVAVSESFIQVLQLHEDKSIRAFGQAALSVGVVKKGCITDEATFSTVLNTLLKETTPHILADENSLLRSFVCLPESQLFTHHVIVPEGVLPKETEAYVYAAASKIIPLDLASLYGSVHVVAKGGVRHATFVGVEKVILDQYVNAFVQAKVRPLFVGGELAALGVALLPAVSPLMESCMIIDIGHSSTTIGAFAVDTVPNDSIVIPFGSGHFTKLVAERLAVSYEEAEKLTYQYGMDSAYEDSQVPAILRECLYSISEKVHEAKVYFEAKTEVSIGHIEITGRAALLPQITQYLSEKLGGTVTIANPLAKLTNPQVLEMTDIPHVMLTQVVGLALAASVSDLDHNNLLTNYQHDKYGAKYHTLDMREVRSLTDLKQVSRYYVRQGSSWVISAVLAMRQYLSNRNVNHRLISSVAILIAAGVFLGWVLIAYL